MVPFLTNYCSLQRTHSSVRDMSQYCSKRREQLPFPLLGYYTLESLFRSMLVVSGSISSKIELLTLLCSISSKCQKSLSGEQDSQLHLILSAPRDPTAISGSPQEHMSKHVGLPTDTRVPSSQIQKCMDCRSEAIQYSTIKCHFLSTKIMVL